MHAIQLRGGRGRYSACALRFGSFLSILTNIENWRAEIRTVCRESRDRSVPARQEKGLEGIRAKRKASTYQAARRSPDWLKIKLRPQQEFVICGTTEGKGSRKHFGALLLGAYRNGKLRYFGHSGTGFTEKGLADAIDRLKPFYTEKPPVENPPKIPEKTRWVKPVFVWEVAFAEWTLDGELRQTTFLRWRDDKTPTEMGLE